MKKVSIIGAGVGGLTAGLNLVSKGFDITIYEQLDTVGGKMNAIGNYDFHFDVGPIVMMPHIYKSVFLDAGLDPNDYISFKKVNPMYRLHFNDGFKMDITTDLEETMTAIEAISEADAEGFLKYLSDIYGRYRIAKDYFINRSFRSPKDFYNPKMLRKGLQLKTFSNAYDLISKYVKNDYLQKMLAFQTLYIGISPHNGQSIYTIIPTIETVYGVWYLKGGMHTMAVQMAKAFADLGGKLKLSTSVEEIVTDKKKVTGLKLKNQFIETDYVVCNADFPYALKNLIKDPKAKGKYTDKKIDSMDYSCSCFLLYLGIDQKVESLGIHNVYFQRISIKI